MCRKVRYDTEFGKFFVIFFELNKASKQRAVPSQPPMPWSGPV